MVVLKRKSFTRWQAAERLSDAVLCGAVREMECGLVVADLGGHLYKLRVARPGGGKRDGYRTLLSAALEADMCSCTDIRKATRRISPMQKRKPCNLQARSFLT